MMPKGPIFVTVKKISTANRSKAISHPNLPELFGVSLVFFFVFLVFLLLLVFFATFFP